MGLDENCWITQLAYLNSTEIFNLLQQQWIVSNIGSNTPSHVPYRLPTNQTDHLGVFYFRLMPRFTFSLIYYYLLHFGTFLTTVVGPKGQINQEFTLAQSDFQEKKALWFQL